MKTAVNYLVKEFSDIFGKLQTTPMQDLLLANAINEALKMEKQQIMYAYNDGLGNGQHYERGDATESILDEYKYYKQTYEQS